jgi:hypothetical protein
MNDTIYREDAIKAMAKAVGRILYDAEEISRHVMNSIPTIEPKQGEWIRVTNGRGGHECSNCHAYAPSYMSGDEHLSDYCPSCGARMFPTQMSER